MNSCVPTLNMYQHEHIDKYSYMFTNVYTLTQKPIVQHTDMYSQRYTYVHIHVCTDIYLQTHVLSHTDTHTHIHNER